MDLRDRLESKYRERASLRSRFDKSITGPPDKRRPKIKKQDISKYVTGTYIPTPDGDIFTARHIYDLDYRVGDFRISDIFCILGRDLGIVDSDARGLRLEPSRILFLDTETTGLAGGAGTVAFMVGIGFFFENKYIVEQYFMRDYDEEHSMLSLLHDRCAEFDAIVSFNGRTFDLPLIEARMILNRLDPLLSRLRGIDLLYAARRIWRLRLDNCRLSTLEEEVLRFERTEDDIPGSLIPGVYFDFIRDGNPDPLYKVFYHNEKDVVSMVGLLYEIFTKLSDPLSAPSMKPLDLYSIGKHLERERKWTAAAACISEASGKLKGARRTESLLRLSMLHKKEDRWEEAVDIWTEITGMQNPFHLLPYVELAKFYEHRVKDFSAALELTERAAKHLSHRRDNDREALLHRAERLKRKIARTELNR